MVQHLVVPRFNTYVDKACPRWCPESCAEAGAGPRNAVPQGLASEECQEVRIDDVGISGHHSVREAGVNLERAMLEQLSLQQCSVLVGYNLVIIALHHEGRHRDRQDS
jgi:hypothetical protein